MDRFESKDIRVFDKFIEKFASKYVDQRMMIKASELIQSPDCGFNTDLLSKVIQKNCVHYDEHREEGERPSVLNDIYRSDFGELLMTYYYEEKIENAEENTEEKNDDAVDYSELSKKQICEILDEKKIEYDSRLNKEKLIALLA